jgi:hypothetical protein
MHCYDCGREIPDPTRALSVMIIEGHSGRLGSAHLHYDCAEPSLSRYRQTIQWEGTIGNLERFKQLHRRVAAANRSSYGSVPLLALALMAALPAIAAEPPQRPYSCRLLDDEHCHPLWRAPRR